MRKGHHFGKSLLSLFIGICLSFTANTQLLNSGTKYYKYFTYQLDNKESKEKYALDPNTKFLYYGKYLIEIVFKLNQISHNSQDSVYYSDSSYYFIDTVTEKCDQYKTFAISANKIASMSWRDKRYGLGYPKDTVGSKRSRYIYKIDDKTIFTDTAINGKSCRYVVFNSSPEIQFVYFFSNDKLDDPFSITSIFGFNHGAVIRIDRINKKLNQGYASELEVHRNSLTVDEIAVIKQWIKNQQTD